MGGLFYQASPCTGIRAGLVGARDSGYDSLRRRLSVLDRLVLTHGVWLQLGLSHQDATRVLQSRPDGVKLKPDSRSQDQTRTPTRPPCNKKPYTTNHIRHRDGYHQFILSIKGSQMTQMSTFLSLHSIYFSQPENLPAFRNPDKDYAYLFFTSRATALTFPTYSASSGLCGLTDSADL